jgi:hypothetical protein
MGAAPTFSREARIVTLDQLVIINRRYHLHLNVSLQQWSGAKIEVNASASEVRECAWIPVLYERFSEDCSTSFKAGQVIQVREKDRDLFFVKDLDGNDKKVQADGVVKGVASCANSNSLWLLEHEDARVGGTIAFDEKVRLRHVASGFYLGATKGGKATKAPSFVISSLGASGDAGPSSGALISLCFEGQLLCTSEDGTALGFEAVRSVRCSLSVNTVSVTAWQGLADIRSKFDRLQELLQEFGGDRSPRDEIHAVLNDVALWESEADKRVIFIEQGGLHILVDVLKLGSRILGNSTLILLFDLMPPLFRGQDIASLVGEAVSLLQEFVLSDNEQLASMSSHALLEVLRDNVWLSTMPAGDVPKFVELLKKRPRCSEVVQLLSALCSVGDAPIASMQLCLASSVSSLLPKFRTEKGSVVAAFGDSSRCVALDQLDNAEDETEYLVSVIELASRLSLGRNEEACELVRRNMISFDVALAALKSESLSGQFKAVFMSYVCSAFLDVMPHKAIALQRRVRVWKEELRAIPSADPVVAAILDVCVRFLRKLPIQVGRRTETWWRRFCKASSISLPLDSFRAMPWGRWDLWLLVFYAAYPVWQPPATIHDHLKSYCCLDARLCCNYLRSVVICGCPCC